MHALSRSVSTKTPASPRSPTTLVAKRTSGSVSDASGSRIPSTSRPRVATTLPPNAHAPRPVRVWVDLTNSPHVLVMRPVVEALRARGAEVEVTARDFAQTVGLAERFGLDAEVIGRHRGGRVAAKAVGLASRARPLARPVRPRPRPRLERRDRRRGDPADPKLDHVRLRVGGGPAHGQLPARA